MFFMRILLSAGDTEAVRVANGGALLLRIRKTVQSGFSFFGRGVTADGAPGDQHGIAGRGGGGECGAEKGERVTGAATAGGVGGKLHEDAPFRMILFLWAIDKLKMMCYNQCVTCRKQVLN